MDRYEIRLSGEGGQGLVSAGAILAQAAGIYGGKFVTYTQSYGPESRGGSCRSDVVVSGEPIDYPICSRLDLLLALTQKACDSYSHQLKPDGLLIVDQNRVSNLPSRTVPACNVPILQTARTQFGKEIVGSIICIGIVGALSGLASEEDLRRAVMARVPKGTEQLNLRALQTGLAMARSWSEREAASVPLAGR